ncbi:hypothetical protein F4679DRAFT_462080 [Xylaria curta]|nr:hypothetical protein F4679DRAFT_462080 [Xylaria curta]
MNALLPARRVQELDLAVANFCAVLTDEQRRDLSNIRNIPDADSIFVFTAQLDYQNRSRKGQSVGSRVSKVLQSTRDFCTIINTYVSSHPEIAALVWGSVQLTIQIVLNYTSYYEAISSLFLQLGHLCPLFAEYGALYPSSKQLQKTVSDFHASIVRCCKHVIEAIRRPCINRTFSLQATSNQGKGQGRVLQAFYRSFEKEFQPDVDDIRRCSDSVKDAINYAKADVDGQERELQAKERTAASEYRDLLGNFLKKQSHDRKQQLLEAFCSHRPEKLLKQNQRKRFGNTANWILSTVEFCNWIATRDPPLLWCSGKIGSGKTVVAASVVDHLFLEKGRSDCLVSYFFIHSSERESLNAETIMKSILRQRLPPPTQLSDEAEKRLRHLSNDGDLDEIVTFLRDITYKSGSSYIVIDGLDECEKRERIRLLQALSSLVATAANTKIFLASRESLEEEIRSHFPTVRQASMDNPDAHDDIIFYIRGILQTKIDMEKLVVGDSSLINEIENALIQGADGMFLWVFFQVQELCEKTCDEDIRHTIENLPENLEETFRRILRRILSRRDSELARKTFPWVAAALRPLSLKELQEAIAIEIGQQYTETGRLCNKVNSIISSCENLLHIDEEDESVQFAHHSIRQFLVEHVPRQQPKDDDLRVFYIDIEEADHFIGEICVTYLHFSDFQTALSQRPKPIILPSPKDIALTALSSKRNFISKLGRKVRSNRASLSVEVDKLVRSSAEPTSKVVYNNTHPFLKYASTNWILHTKNFRNEKSKTWNLWKEIITSGHDLAVTPWQPEASSGDINIQEWAIQATHFALICIIETSGEFWRPTGWKVICEAIRDNYAAIIGIGLRCRKPDGVTIYVFPECPTSSYLDIADKLLAAGADVDASSWSTAVLREAAENRYLHVVKMLLLTIKPAIGVVDGAVETVLTVAARKGHVNIVEAILAAGADIDLESWGLGIAFDQAIAQGNLDVAGMMLKLHKTSDMSFVVQRAFCDAAAYGYLDVVERLLTVGADVNVMDKEDKTPLNRAITRGHLNIVERLLKAGANVDTPDHNGKIALSTAVEHGHLIIFEKLLQVGADINIPDNERKTVLSKAARHGYLNTVERLLKAGANVNISDNKGKTALSKAAKHGYVNTVERLLKAGAHVKISDNKGRTALSRAAECGHLNIVERLLTAGAYAHAMDREGRTAVDKATMYGYRDIVKRLSREF